MPRPIRPSLEKAFLPLFCAFVVGCASSPPKSLLPDEKEEKMQVLLDKVGTQEDRIEKLLATVEDLKGKLKKNEVKASNQSEKKAAPKVQTVKLLPGETDDAEGESSRVEEGTPIASSAHEPMHFYFKGVHLLKEALYEDALKNFREFLEVAPEHVYADRAEFWIAETHFKNKEYGLAVVATNMLEARYPQSLRLPDALLRRADSYLNLGNKDEARATLRNLIIRFPDHPSSEQASKKLAEISDKLPVDRPRNPIIIDE